MPADDAPLTLVSSAPDSLILRELRAIREIAHAFLMADRPADVYQFALDRVTPILGATFSLIMHIGEDGELLRPVAQHEWPAKHRNWIGALRVRVGDGPSGLAVAERRLVEVPDLFADPSLDAWYPVAEELGFRSIVAAPLIGAHATVGVIAFYFADPTPVSDEQRALVRLVADQLAATADKAAMIDALRRSNAALAEANAALEHEVTLAEAARATRDRLLLALTAQVCAGAAERGDATPRATAIAAHELAQVMTATIVTSLTEIDPRTPLLEAIQRWRSAMREVPISLGEPTILLPTMRTDASWLARALELVIGQVINRLDRADGIHADVEVGRGFVAHRLAWRGRPLPDPSEPQTQLLGASANVVSRHAGMSSLDFALAVALVKALGGDVQRDTPDHESQSVTIVFPIEDRVD